MSIWDYESDEQKQAMEEKITPENCGTKLKLVREVSGMSRKDLAFVLGCSESTLSRIETQASLPTDDFMNRIKALVIIGYHKFSKLSDQEKDDIGTTLSVAGGVATGLGGSIAAVSGAGSMAGFSAAGITSGLAAVGGGSMLAGLGMVAAIPVAAGLAGYGLVKGIKAICKANDLSCKEVDGRFEIVPDPSLKS